MLKALLLCFAATVVCAGPFIRGVTAPASLPQRRQLSEQIAATMKTKTAACCACEHFQAAGKDAKVGCFVDTCNEETREMEKVGKKDKATLYCWDVEVDSGSDKVAKQWGKACSDNIDCSKPGNKLTDTSEDETIDGREFR